MSVRVEVCLSLCLQCLSVFLLTCELALEVCDVYRSLLSCVTVCLSSIYQSIVLFCMSDTSSGTTDCQTLMTTCLLALGNFGRLIFVCLFLFPLVKLACLSVCF